MVLNPNAAPVLFDRALLRARQAASALRRCVPNERGGAMSAAMG